MLVTVTPSASPTPFDKALAAAWSAGWIGRAGFDAVVVMLASGLPAEEIERLFRDCMLRIQ